MMSVMFMVKAVAYFVMWFKTGSLLFFDLNYFNATYITARPMTTAICCNVLTLCVNGGDLLLSPNPWHPDQFSSG